MSEARSRLADRLAGARPRVVAALAARWRDLDLAEDAFGAACEALLSHTGEDVRDPAAWLYRAALRKAIDAKRKAGRDVRIGEAAMTMGDTHAVLAMPEPIPDERLRLLFVCCHPALAPDARVALALRVVCGVSTEHIARAFAVPVPTMLQRITRGKAKIAKAKIPFELPPRREWPERAASVLGALEVSFTQVYEEHSEGGQSEIADDVVRLAKMLVELLPDHAEAKGFAALVLLAGSRLRARHDDEGAMVPLSQQDPALWDSAMIEEGRVLLDAAAALAAPGPYQLLAAIHLTHARRLYDGTVDALAVATLYAGLSVLRPGPIVAINHALALAELEGPVAGLAALDAVGAETLANHRPLCVARARLLERLGREREAAAMLDRALATAPPKGERLYLLKWCSRLAAQG